MGPNAYIELLCFSCTVSSRCDVSNREEVLALAARVRAEVGDVTMLVNNAGIMPCRPLPNHKPEEIRKIFDVNVLAHFWIIID
ncbi:hypothetical protein LSTR_LSTR016821 [Laodelphax striatellus]|uniref:Uncharacterized protein n=1 Tax=Laodelphax striatellus TaxID=195883 RepID=A0A482WGZ8_LAOST|nr:hypothetical protein LSTR_LSTR016821 [Laodelphax striatellus]